jgi:hypothetical protein
MSGLCFFDGISGVQAAVVIEPGEETLPQCVLHFGQDYAIHSLVDYPKYTLGQVEDAIDNLPDHLKQDLEREVSLDILFHFFSVISTQ